MACSANSTHPCRLSEPMSPTEYAPLVAIGIQTVVFLFGGGAMVLRASQDNKELREDMKGMQEELKGLAKIVTEQAVQSQRLNDQGRRMTMLEARIEDLRRGKGYVNDRDATSMDREY